MSKGGGSSERTSITKTDTEPWEPQQDYLKDIWEQAQTLYNADKPSYYPESTVTDFSPETEAALSAIRDRAIGGSALQDAGKDVFSKTLAGDYLSGSPFFEGAFEAQVRPAVEQFRSEITPGINAGFNQAGRFGSNAFANARNTADDTFARAMSDTGGKLAYQNYATERGLQNQAALMAPQYAQNDYLDAARLAGVGEAREGKQGEFLQDAINRWNFDQNIGGQKLADYAALVGGGDWGGSQSTATPIYRSKGSGILGGAMGGAGLANMASFNPLLGALGGGLLGAWG